MNKEAEIIKFHPEHLNLMDVREHEVKNILKVEGAKERLEALIEVGTSGTIVYDGKILGVMGIFDIWKGVCEVWVLPCKNIPQHALIFARIIKKYLNNIVGLKHYDRIQVTALNNKTQNRFFQWLGFELETPNGMKNFSNAGCNYNMWSITNGGSSRV